MVQQVVHKLLQLIGVVLIAGAPTSWVVFRQPRVGGEGDVAIDQGTVARLRRRAVFGAVSLCVGSALQIRHTFGPVVGGLPIVEQLVFLFELLLHSRVGRFAAFRALAAAAAVVLLFLGTGRGSRLRRAQWADLSWRTAIVGAGLYLTWTIAQSGHATGGPAPMVSLYAQWLHLTIVSLWAGGVLSFASLPWERFQAAPERYRAPLAAGLSTLSRIGMAAVAVFVITGIVLSSLYVYSVSVAAGSLYGRTLFVKVLVVAIALAAAGVNRFWVLPKFRTADASSSAAFRRVANFLRVEAAAIMVIFALSAVISQTPPVRTPGVITDQSWNMSLETLDITIELTSGGPSELVFEVHAWDAGVNRAADLDEPELHLDMPGHYMGVPPLRMEAVRPGLYVASANVGMAGPWNAVLLWRHGDDVQSLAVSFVVMPASEQDYSPAQRLLARRDGAVLLFLASLTVAVVGLGLLAPGGPRSPAGLGAKSARIALGGFLAVIGVVWSAQLGGMALPGLPQLVFRDSGDSVSPTSTGDPPSAGLDPVGAVRLPVYRQARDAGEYLVEVNVYPAAVGNNVLHLRVQDYEGFPLQDADVTALLSSSRSSVPPLHVDNFEQPSDGVYVAEIDLETEDLWELAVQIGPRTGDGQEVVFELPVPLNGARELLRLSDQAMNRLQSVRIREELRGMPDGPIVTNHAMVAPNRMHIQSSVGLEMIVVGDTRYQRVLPNETWRPSRWPQPGGFRWPDFDYASLGFGETLLRVDSIDGRSMFVVTLVQDPPWILYTLWIDAMDYRIHRLEMMATGHYMYWTFYDFNEPISIEPPVDAAP